MRRWPLLLLTVSGLAFLASLYLPWQDARRAGHLGPFLSLGDFAIDGWTSFGYATALFAIVVAVGSAAGLVRPQLGAGLPLGRCALFVGYGAAAVAVLTWDQRHYYEAAVDVPVRYRMAYGAYLGITAGAAAVVGALALRWDELRWSVSVRLVAMAFAIVGLLVAFTLPWVHSQPAHASESALESAGAVVATAAALWTPEFPLLAPVPLLFSAGVLSALAPYGDAVYGAWLGLASAAVLLLARVLGVRVRLSRPARLDTIVLCAAAVGFASTLFLPWLGPFVGWTFLGTICAALAVALVFAAIVPLPVSPLELAAAFALYLTTQGVVVAESAQSPDYELQTGAALGLAFGGALIAIALVRWRHVRLPGDRVALRLAAVGAVVLYLAVLLLPTWHVFPERVRSALVFTPVSWFAVACVLLGIRLAAAWLRQPIAAAETFFIPLAVLTVVILWLIGERAYRLNWGGGWIVVTASLVLALLGWLEGRGRVEGFWVPELLRVDRL